MRISFTAIITTLCTLLLSGCIAQAPSDTKVASTAPQITAVAGNAPNDATRIADGLVVSGSLLGHATFALSNDAGTVPLTVRSQSDQSAEVVLPADVRQGLHALAATNDSGTAQANVTLQLPDLSGDTLVDRINTTATTKLAVAAMPDEFAALQAQVAALQNRIISSSVTLAVGAAQTYKSPLDALAYLADKTIMAGAVVTIQLDSGFYNFASGQSLEVNHHDGDRIRIIGDEAHPDQVNLTFTDTDGVVVHDNHVLGYLSGLTIHGPTADAGVALVGVHAHSGGAIHGNAVVVTTFKYGFWAEGGTITGGGLEADANFIGFLASQGGYLSAPSAAAKSNVYGFYATRNGFILANSAMSTGNTDTAYGFRADQGGDIEAPSSTADNSGHGYFVLNGGSIEATGATAINNTVGGFCAGSGSIAALRSSVSNNQPTDFRSGDSFGVIDANGATTTTGGTPSFDITPNVVSTTGGYIAR
jgi:hypothetical protein